MDSQQNVVLKTNTVSDCNFILLRTLCSHVALQTVAPPQVHSQHSLPDNNHLLRRLVKTFAITKGVVFVYFSFIYCLHYHNFFLCNWNFIGTVTKFVYDDYTNVTERRYGINNTLASCVIDPGSKSRSGCRFPDWGVYGFLYFLQRNSRRVLQFRPRHFVQHCVQLIFHLLF